MNKNVKFIKTFKHSLKRHAPEILTGVGIAGMITSTVLAVAATPKAIRIIEDIENEKGRKAKTGEKFKACWKCYAPAAVTTVASAACLIGASTVHNKRNAVLATAYKLSEAALIEYKDKVVETIGEKKEKIIRDKIAEDKVTENPISKNSVIVTGKGTSKCYDMLTGVYFNADITAIKAAKNRINEMLLDDGYASLNDFYDELNIPHTKLGYELGWSMYNGGLMDVDFGAVLTDEGDPCIVIEYDRDPSAGYQEWR